MYIGTEVLEVRAFAQHVGGGGEGEPGVALAQVLGAGAGREDVFFVLHAGAVAVANTLGGGDAASPAGLHLQPV